jgi:site-specific recombinase XerD
MFFYLKEPNSNTESLIIIQYYVKSENKKFKLSTQLKINPKDWSKENRLPRLKRGGDSYKNRKITDQLLALNDKLHQAIDKHGSSLTIGHLKEHFIEKKKDIIYLEDFWNVFIEERIKMQEVGNKRILRYKVVLLKFMEFQNIKNEKYNLKKLNNDFYSSFISYLREEHNLYDNTLHSYFSVFKTLLLWIKKKGYEINNDYKNFSIKKHETNDIHLTEEELNLLEEAELTGAEERARDLFLVGAYTGQRFSDYSMFEKADVRQGAIVKKAKKTKITSFIPLHTKLKKLLDKYEWKLPKISSQKFNVRIQQVCKKLEISDPIKKVSHMGKNKKEEITPKWRLVGSHTARRTYITLMSERGMADHQLMQVAGIKDVKTLLKYKKFNLNTLIETSNKLWS